MGRPPRDETHEAALAFGLALPESEAAKPAPIQYWPGDEDAVMLFQAMRTQWRTSMAGYVGLDYGVVQLVADQLGIGRKRLKQAFGPLRVMEDEALVMFDEQAKRSKD